MAQTWRTVRVFISSTFRDMHAERDYLIKIIFPELREHCARRYLHLVDIDLRWGVTEDEAEQGKVLHIILDEIERSRPFFIAILGERYGFVPNKIPEDAEISHPWLRDYTGHSLTALEIIHGVLRNPVMAKRSFFYFRDPHFISGVPENKRIDFMAENPVASQKLAALKDKIRTSGRPVMENYPCGWDEKASQLAGLDIFGQQVLGELWAAICEEYPEEEPEIDPVAVERQMHEAFTEERSYLHVGRAEQVRQLTEYVQGTDRRSVVVTGESGCGKSAFLASWYRRYTEGHPDDCVLAYFIGASPDSTEHRRLLRHMCLELKQRFNLKEEIPEDAKKLSGTLATLLATASLNKSQIILIIDALDQLSAFEGAHGLGWLLDYIPEKIKLVVSSLEGECLDVLRRRQAEEMPLPLLTEREQQEIVKILLNEWRRKLDDQQITALLAHPGARNPLYLRVALEELRLFGRYEQLTMRIEALPEGISSLFEQVLVRLERDYDHELVSETFSLLGCSRYGLSEAELIGLLSGDMREPLPRTPWARLVRGTKGYLTQRGELFGFSHQQLAEAVATRYPSQREKHAKLAAYFGKAPLERKLDEYPYQLQQAEMWLGLATALSDLDLFGNVFENKRTYEWMGYWRGLGGRFEPGPCYQSAIEALEHTEGETQKLGHLYHLIALLLYEMALYTPALGFEQRAVNILIKKLGNNHTEVAASLNNLGRILSEKGGFINVRKALRAYQQALEIESSTGTQDDIRKVNYLNNVAVVLAQNDLYKESLPLFVQVLEILENKLGSHHLEVAVALNNLAGLYHKQQNYAGAKSLYERSLDIKEHSLDPNHPEIADTLGNLASMYIEQKRYDEARPLIERAQNIWERSLGPEHPRIAANLNNLATLYTEQKKYKEALPLFRRAFSIAKNSLGKKHPDTKQLKDNMENCVACTKFSVLWMAVRLERLFPGGALVLALALGAMIIFLPLKGGSLFTTASGAFLAIGYSIGGKDVARGIKAGLFLSLAIGIGLLANHRIGEGLPAINDSVLLGTGLFLIICAVWGVLGGASGVLASRQVRTIFFKKIS